MGGCIQGQRAIGTWTPVCLVEDEWVMKPTSSAKCTLACSERASAPRNNDSWEDHGGMISTRCEEQDEREAVDSWEDLDSRVPAAKSSLSNMAETAIAAQQQNHGAELSLTLSRFSAMQPRSLGASAGAELDSWEDLASPTHAAFNDDATQQPRNVEASGAELDSWEALASPTHAPSCSARHSGVTQQPVIVEARVAAELDSWEDLASPTCAPQNSENEVCEDATSSTQPSSIDHAQEVRICSDLALKVEDTECLQLLDPSDGRHEVLEQHVETDTPLVSPELTPFDLLDSSDLPKADAVPHHPVDPFVAPVFDVDSSVPHSCANISHASMAPVMWVPMLVPLSWAPAFPQCTSMSSVFQYPSCMSQSFHAPGAALIAYDPAQCAQIYPMPMHASTGTQFQGLHPDPLLAQQCDGQLLGYASSAAPGISDDATDVKQADGPRRKRSKAGQMNQVIRWRNRLALHRERHREVTACVAAGSEAGVVAADPSNILQPPAQDSSLNVANLACNFAVSDAAEASQETPMRPTYSAILCQGLPGRAAPANSNRHRQ